MSSILFSLITIDNNKDLINLFSLRYFCENHFHERKQNSEDEKDYGVQSQP